MIKRDALQRQLQLYKGWTYSRDDPRYPVQLPGVRLPSSPPNQANCCAFVEGLIVGAAAASDPDLKWHMPAHRRSMIWHADDKFGPVNVLVDAGLASIWEKSASVPPPVWSVCQGWRGPRGHTFLVVDTHDDDVLILEANHGYGLNGVGYRGHGPEAPGLWYREPRRWTWTRVLATYPELSVATLDLEPDPDLDLAELECLPTRDFDADSDPEAGGSNRA